MRHMNVSRVCTCYGQSRAAFVSLPAAHIAATLLASLLLRTRRFRPDSATIIRLVYSDRFVTA
jgi:hypothetical protein